eukprot:17257_4
MPEGREFAFVAYLRGYRLLLLLLFKIVRVVRGAGARRFIWVCLVFFLSLELVFQGVILLCPRFVVPCAYDVEILVQTRNS